MKNIAHFLDGINEIVGKTVAWLTTILVILFCYDVLMRYLFNNTKVWIGEMEWHLFALLFLLAAGYAFKDDRHVRVDLFYTNFSEKTKALINLLGCLIFLIPWCLVIIKSSAFYANNSWLAGEGSPNPGGLPYRFIIKYAITAGFVLLLIQCASTIIHSFLTLIGQSTNTKH